MTEHVWEETGVSVTIVAPANPDGGYYIANCTCCWVFMHPDLDACRKQACAHLEKPHDD